MRAFECKQHFPLKQWAMDAHKNSQTKYRFLSRKTPQSSKLEY